MIYFSILALFLLSCNPDQATPPANNTTVMNPEQKKYWYNGEAEISSYELKQGRYGEIREGKAALVFVTEPFSPSKNTKSDRASSDDVSVLKLNFTKKFNTGVYPYSMMTSSFFPFENGKHSLKVSSSSQEWCGHTYMELKNKKSFEVQVNSYFEGESSNNTKLEKAIIEDDIWSMIRLQPEALPKGKQQVIPSFFYLRLLHKELKSYTCEMEVTKLDAQLNNYSLKFLEIDGQVDIQFEASFPHKIISWKESYSSGFGSKKQRLETSGQLIKSIKSDYWNKNSNADGGLRDTLGL